jgi:hypothetical protein
MNKCKTALNSEHLVRLIDVAKTSSSYYFIIESVEGHKTLREMIKSAFKEA